MRLRSWIGPLCAAAGLIAGWTAAGHWHAAPARVIAAYHTLFHRNGDATYQNTRWLGVQAQKCPLDMWVFQEILFETRPDVVVETGTYKGGSAFFHASILDLLGHGRILTVDIEDFPGKPRHGRITYLRGSSTADETLERIRSSIAPGEKVMVFLDSDHSRDHVLTELRLYSPLVTPGCYLIVEDTHFNGHPILPKFGPGPMEALHEFLPSHPEFVADRGREKYGMTFNPGGFLKRIR
jgi:cephalosporin hydroxylase